MGTNAGSILPHQGNYAYFRRLITIPAAVRPGNGCNQFEKDFINFVQFPLPPHGHTAIILFSRSAVEESRHKRFSPRVGQKGNVAIAGHLIERSKRVARTAGVDFIALDSTTQTGNTFGERLTNAVEGSFAKGYDRLLVIGNDCPELTTGTLREAIRALDHQDAVLGPATDGGVYLIGISRPFFRRPDWRQLPWQRAELGAALADALGQLRARVHVLSTLADVDNEKDLRRVIQRNPHALFCQLIRSILAAGGVACRPLSPPFYPTTVLSATPHRGPPSAK